LKNTRSKKFFGSLGGGDTGPDAAEKKTTKRRKRKERRCSEKQRVPWVSCGVPKGRGPKKGYIVNRSKEKSRPHYMELANPASRGEHRAGKEGRHVRSKTLKGKKNMTTR